MGLVPRQRVARSAVGIWRSQISGYTSPQHFTSAQRPLGVRCVSLGDNVEDTNEPGQYQDALGQIPEGIDHFSRPLVEICNAMFYEEHPSARPTKGPNSPILSREFRFTLPSDKSDTDTDGRSRKMTWCVIGANPLSATLFLQILGGKFICIPPKARQYHPLLDQQSIRYVGFDTTHRGGGLGKLASSYLAERYESRQDGAHFTLRDYLLDNTELNPLSTNALDSGGEELLNQVVDGLQLRSLLDLPVIFLSNGQTRRAMIAHALLHRPRLLLLDDPFMGLDPPTVVKLSAMLCKFASNAAPLAEDGKQSPNLVLSVRPQDPLPYWITNVVLLRKKKKFFSGGINDAFKFLHDYAERDGARGRIALFSDIGKIIGRNSIWRKYHVYHQVKLTKRRPAKRLVPVGEPVVEMDGCLVKYGEKSVLGDWQEKHQGSQRSGLHWTVRRGERWGVFGPNGSGKTTLVSLLSSDHPQAYSLPIKLFGRSRLPDPSSGEAPLTFWDIQARIGHSSPEVHQHMPRDLSIRQVLESAWADTFRSKPKLDDWAAGQIDTTLRCFSSELNREHRELGTQKLVSLDWANSWLFGELSFSAQRVLLFLRAVVKHPDIVVLDEAFSGMSWRLRDKCMNWLENGSQIEKQGKFKGHKPAVEGLQDRQALICISHVQDEVPDCVTKWMCLPEAHTGDSARFGSLEGPLGHGNLADWNRIWGLELKRKKEKPVVKEGAV